MKRLTGILCLLFIAVAAFGQRHELPIIQFSGIIHNADSTKAIVPYVSITNISYNQSVHVSNYEGYFSFPVHENDTLKFSSVGYATITVVVPSNVRSRSYLADVMLKPQIINLPVFHVFPWATTEEFRKDFIGMKLADDDLEIAKKNVSRSSLMALARTLPRDGIETYSFQDFHNSVMNAHSLPVNNLLNPFSWANLIKEISDGDKSRSSDN